MKHNDGRADLAQLQESVTALAVQMGEMYEALGRVEARLDTLYDECQRIGIFTQRTVLRQESIAKSLNLIEQALYRE